MYQYMADNNELRGSLPDGLGSLTCVTKLCLSENHLAGSLPESLSGLSLVHTLEMSRNSFSGSLPHAFVCLRRLEVLFLYQNRLTGTLPCSLGELPKLFMLVLTENVISGSLTGKLMSPRLKYMDHGKNMLEGALPSGLGSLTMLRMLGVSGEEQRPRVRGVLPLTMVRLMQLSLLLAEGQHLQGPIPRFASTIYVMACHRNSLKALQRLRLNASGTVLLHCNHLSCLVPTGQELVVDSSGGCGQPLCISKRV